MRNLKYLLILLLAPFCFAQTSQTTIIPPCTLNFTLTPSILTSNNFNNSAAGCDKWTLTLYTVGSGSFTLTLQDAPGATPSTPGSFVTYAGTTVTGSNPMTAMGIATFTNGTVATPWLRLLLSGVSGSITVYGILQGSQTVVSKGGGGSGGPSAIAGTVNEIGISPSSPCSSGTCTVFIPNNPVFPGLATAAGFSSAESFSGSLLMNGLTSGAVQIAVADIAGTAIAYVLPSTNGVAGQFLQDTGVVTCPTLPAGSPSVCHGTVWTAATIAGGTCTSQVITVISSSGGVTCASLTPAFFSNFSADNIMGNFTGSAAVPSTQSIPACANDGDHALVYVTHVLTCELITGGGGSGAAGATLFSTINSTTVTATSPTTLIGSITGSATVPANTFTAGQVLEFMAQGFYSTPATPASLTIALSIGGTVRITTGAVVQIASVTTGVWRARCAVTTRTAGSSGTQIANCIFEGTGATLTAGESPMQTSSAWTIDTTATQAIDFLATWSTATGSPTITSTNIAAWIPGAPVTSVASLTGAVPGQGTDSNVLTAGTFTGATGAAICKDANGGATTIGCSGGGTTVSVAAPYLTVGATTYVQWDLATATKPSAPTYLNSVSCGISGAGTNGDFIVQNNSAITCWGGYTATTSIEGDISFAGITPSGGADAGIWIWDSTNNRIWELCMLVQSGGNAARIAFISWTYNGTGNPSSPSSTASSTPIGPMAHFKLSVSAGTLTLSLSQNGGANFSTITTESVGTISKAGFVLDGEGALNVFSLSIS